MLTTSAYVEPRSGWLQRASSRIGRLVTAGKDYIQVTFRQGHLGSNVRSRDYAKAFDEMLVVDPFQLRRDLNVYARAVEDGSQKYPAPGAEEMDAFHRDLLARMDQTQMQQTATRINVLQRFVGDLSSVWIETPDESLRTIYNRAVKVDLRKVVDDCKPRLLALRTNLGLAARAYSAFRFFNNRTSEAKSPTTASMIAAAVSIAVAGAIEIFVNKWALAPKLPQGDLDSYIVSTAICFANVSLPLVLAATFGRGKNLVRYSKRRQRHARSLTGYVSLLGLAAGGAGLLLMNGFFAYSRWKLEDFAKATADAGMTDVGKAIAKNASEFSLSQWDWLLDPYSALMFIFGLIMALVAAYHGAHGFSDPYPGYLAVSKRKTKAEFEFERERETLHEESKAVFDEARNAMRDVISVNQEKMAFFQEQMRRFQNLRAVHEGEYERLEITANMLAADYRENNRLHRAGAAVPAYFDEPISLPRRYGFWTLGVEDAYEKLARDMQKLEDAANKYMSHLALAEEVEQGRLQKLLDEVEGKASDRLKKFAPVLSQPQADTFDF